MTEPFTGWPPTVFEWLDGLAAENTRAWFIENRPVYEAVVRGPMVKLLAELSDEFGPGEVSRPNRDIRVSTDKSPYKLEVYGRVPFGGGIGNWYVQVRREGFFVGGGLYAPARPLMTRVRNAIADERTGALFADIVAEMREAGVTLMDTGALRSVPRGFDAEHPRADLLRLIHFAGGVQYPVEPWLHTAEAKDRVVDGWRAVRPLLEWLATHS
jgi:uncharacterized protein (TIGR02453 family)